MEVSYASLCSGEDYYLLCRPGNRNAERLSDFLGVKEPGKDFLPQLEPPPVPCRAHSLFSGVNTVSQLHISLVLANSDPEKSCRLILEKLGTLSDAKKTDFSTHTQFSNIHI